MLPGATPGRMHCGFGAGNLKRGGSAMPLRGLEAAGPIPVIDVLRIGKRLKHDGARRVEHSRNQNFPVCGDFGAVHVRNPARPGVRVFLGGVNHAEAGVGGGLCTGMMAA